MKRIVIGRANDSDIIIPDESDNVSRHHAVITCRFFGKMTLSDTSSNGTFINDTKMLKGASIPVTRNDRILLGDSWVLDWNVVEDPYKTSRWLFYILTVLLLFSAIGLTVWRTYDSNNKKEETPVTLSAEWDTNNESDSWNKDSTEKVAPTEKKIIIPEKLKKNEDSKGKSSKKKK